MAEKEKNEFQSDNVESIPCVEHGKVSAIDDLGLQQFYGSATTESYRLKSELMGQFLEDIGMGR